MGSSRDHCYVRSVRRWSAATTSPRRRRSRLRIPVGPSAPPSNTRRLLARDRAAPESTLALTKAAQPCCGRVRPLAWCSRPRNSAALLEGALVHLVGLVLAGVLGLPPIDELPVLQQLTY